MRYTIRCTGILLAFTITAAAHLLEPSPARAQDRRDDQFYYPGAFNWRFLGLYPEAARLFNAFDYGHAVLYEKLLTEGVKTEPALAREYRYLTRDLLITPPRFAIAEEAVMPSYAKLAWRAKQMFDWAHVLHRQIYDVYADDRLSIAGKDSLIERLTDYYLSRRDYAFSPVPKSMDRMEAQEFSQIFRREYPTFNGLIWAYHWLQVGLYEPMLGERSKAEKKEGVHATLAGFWEMVEKERYPTTMPMTPAVAPEFSRRHPRAAVIFDNLHMMHDIISDILVSERIPRRDKRSMIYRQLDEFRDSTSHVITIDEWRNMGAEGHEGHPPPPPADSLPADQNPQEMHRH